MFDTRVVKKGMVEDEDAHDRSLDRVLGLDFAVWLEHWASHKIPLLWRFHRMHHARLLQYGGETEIVVLAHVPHTNRAVVRTCRWNDGRCEYLRYNAAVPPPGLRLFTTRPSC